MIRGSLIDSCLCPVIYCGICVHGLQLVFAPPVLLFYYLAPIIWEEDLRLWYSALIALYSFLSSLSEGSVICSVQLSLRDISLHVLVSGRVLYIAVASLTERIDPFCLRRQVIWCVVI